MKAPLVSFWLVLLCVAGCAPEPEGRIVQSTADKDFTLVLAAPQNHVMPEGSVPIQVELAYSGAPLDEDLSIDIDLVASNGQLDADRLSVIFPSGEGAENRFVGWVTFTAFRGLTSRHQGEVHALFGEIHARVKIRIDSPPEIFDSFD